MATKQELFKEMSEAASKGDVEAVNRITKAINEGAKVEREALIALTAGERDSWKELVTAAVEGVTVTDVVYELVVRHPGRDDESLSLVIKSDTFIDTIKEALQDVLEQAPESVQSLTVDRNGVKLNTTATRAKGGNGGGTNSMGWRYGVGGDVVGLTDLWLAHSNDDDKAAMLNIDAGLGMLGDKTGRDDRQKNSDRNQLKKKVATRAGFIKA